MPGEEGQVTGHQCMINAWRRGSSYRPPMMIIAWRRGSTYRPPMHDHCLEKRVKTSHSFCKFRFKACSIIGIIITLVSHPTKPQKNEQTFDNNNAHFVSVPYIRSERQHTRWMQEVTHSTGRTPAEQKIALGSTV